MFNIGEFAYFSRAKIKVLILKRISKNGMISYRVINPDTEKIETVLNSELERIVPCENPMHRVITTIPPSRTTGVAYRRVQIATSGHAKHVKSTRKVKYRIRPKGE